jgi:glycosyltransferase involved in cell wall biosynthesis
MHHTKMVFLAQTSGHHLEYFNHLYKYIGENKKQEKYVFVVPEEFHNLKDKFFWESYENISFHYINKIDLKGHVKNKFKKAFYLSRLLKKTMKELNSKDVFLIDLMTFLPFLPFFLTNKNNVSGIIYHIYLYKWKESSILSKIQDVLKYLLFAKFSCFSNIFILNDSSAFRRLNTLYKVNKFKYLVDPIVPIKSNGLKDLRSQLSVNNEDQIILHFGAMTRTKGTLDVLDFVKRTPENQLKNMVFVFAGVIKSDIRKEFYKLFDELKVKCRIFVFDEFLDFDFTASLFNSSDIVFCPYQRIYQSSGVIGYSVQFNKPVIVPNQGLLGKLVRNNKIGITYDKFEYQIILDILFRAKKYRISNDYLKNHTIEEFSSTILKSF